jgi:hypothetical protein
MLMKHSVVISDVGETAGLLVDQLINKKSAGEKMVELQRG